MDGELTHLRPRGRLDCSDGQVLHDWCLQGMGIAWRSTWEVEREVAEGRLVALLEDFAAPPNGIYAVFPQRKHLPLRVRLWIDFLKHSYGDPAYWQRPRRLALTRASQRVGCSFGAAPQPPASATHFLVKLVLAAPASFFSAACASQAAAALLPPRILLALGDEAGLGRAGELLLGRPGLRSCRRRRHRLRTSS